MWWNCLCILKLNSHCFKQIQTVSPCVWSNYLCILKLSLQCFKQIQTVSPHTQSNCLCILKLNSHCFKQIQIVWSCMQWKCLSILKLNSGDIDKSTVGWLYLIENNNEIFYWWCISHLSHSSVQAHPAQLLPGIILFILFITNLSLQQVACSMQFSTSAHAPCNTLQVLWVYKEKTCLLPLISIKFSVF